MRGRRKGGCVVRAAQGGAGRGVAGWPCTSARNNMPCGPIIVGAEHVMAVRHASPSSSTSIQRGLEEGLGELMEVMVMVMERCWAASLLACSWKETEKPSRSRSRSRIRIGGLVGGSAFFPRSSTAGLLGVDDSVPFLHPRAVRRTPRQASMCKLPRSTNNPGFVRAVYYACGVYGARCGRADERPRVLAVVLVERRRLVA